MLSAIVFVSDEITVVKTLHPCFSNTVWPRIGILQNS